jgi:signal transduction histidine kinase
MRERWEGLVRLLDREALGKTPGRRAFAREALAKLVERARDEVVDATRTDVAIEIHVSRDVELDADATSLGQAIENALKNAVEAQRGRPGKVVVRARTEDGGAVVELSIEDAGAGMSAAEMARLFVPHETNKQGGTGVGMSTLKRVVETTHRGKVRVESEEGRGTRVVMRLPARRSE